MFLNRFYLNNNFPHKYRKDCMRVNLQVHKIIYICLFLGLIFLDGNGRINRSFGEDRFHPGIIDLRLGNRFFVVSFLENIFGQENISRAGGRLYDKLKHNKYPITTEYILSKRSVWGGGCDIYDLSEESIGVLEFPKNHCHFTGDPINPNLILGSSVVREGYRIKTCEEILSIDSAIDHALSQADISSGVSPAPESISKVYSLFFPTRNTDNDDFMALSTELVNLGQNDFASTSQEHWRYILLTLCFDPSWQIL